MRAGSAQRPDSFAWEDAHGRAIREIFLHWCILNSVKSSAALQTMV